MSSPSITKTSAGYSATVQMQVIVGARQLAVAQLGPDFLILAEPADMPPGQAELVVQIDGAEKRRMILLPDGIRISDERTRVAAFA